MCYRNWGPPPLSALSVFTKATQLFKLSEHDAPMAKTKGPFLAAAWKKGRAGPGWAGMGRDGLDLGVGAGRLDRDERNSPAKEVEREAVHGTARMKSVNALENWRLDP